MKTPKGIAEEIVKVLGEIDAMWTEKEDNGVVTRIGPSPYDEDYCKLLHRFGELSSEESLRSLAQGYLKLDEDINDLGDQITDFFFKAQDKLPFTE